MRFLKAVGMALKGNFGLVYIWLEKTWEFLKVEVSSINGN